MPAIDLPASLVAAVEAGDFAALRQLSACFVAGRSEAFQQCLESGEREAIARETLEILRYCLTLARIHRSNICARLRTIERQALYSTQRVNPHRWQIEA